MTKTESEFNKELINLVENFFKEKYNNYKYLNNKQEDKVKDMIDNIISAVDEDVFEGERDIDRQLEEWEDEQFGYVESVADYGYDAYAYARSLGVEF